MNKRKNNTSPLKIAVLGHKTIPSRQGGIEIVVEELTVRMAKLGHKITVYNRSGHHVSGKEFDGKKLKEYKGIRMKYVPTIDKKGLAAMSASFFAGVAAAFGKYDVVHFHAEGPCAMLWLPKLFGKRCIATVHGLDPGQRTWCGGEWNRAWTEPGRARSRSWQHRAAGRRCYRRPQRSPAACGTSRYR